MTDAKQAFPVTLRIDYPDRQLNRLTTFFRCFMLIPIGIVLAFLSGPGWGWGAGKVLLGAGPILFIPTLLMILFRQKYPRWWFDWNLHLTRFSTRVGAYCALLTDAYPSTEDEQSVHISIPYPDAKKDLLPGMPLVKWFLAIPHLFLLCFLGIGAGVSIIISWFAILFTGRYPKSLFEFVVGVCRWCLRVCAYAFLLVTDVYPPFSLD